jgi:hypothetical protein
MSFCGVERDALGRVSWFTRETVKKRLDAPFAQVERAMARKSESAVAGATHSASGIAESIPKPSHS